MQQRRHYRGIHTARQAQNHFIIANLGAHIFNALLNNIGRHPIVATAANTMHKILNNLPSIARMRDFRVKLNTIKMPRLICKSGQRCVFGFTNDTKALRNRTHTITMTHPHINDIRFNALKQFTMSMQIDHRMAIFFVI